ncbi:MAG: hypothetical protein V7784_19555 [Oceanospirillaceae bacterium]
MQVSNNRSTRYLSAALLLTMSPLAIALACDLQITRIEEASRSSALKYDVFNRDGLIKRFDLYIQRTDDGDAPCSAAVRVLPQGLTRLINAGNSQLQYRLQPLETDGVYRNGELRLQAKSIAKGQQLKFSYQVLFTAEQFVASGMYQDKLWLEVSDPSQVDKPFLERRDTVLTASVAPAARISFAGTQGRSQLVDFGELTDGKQISPAPQIVIQSTGSFAMTFSSLNRGALRHQSGKEKWDIPYQSALAGRTLPLTEYTTTLRYTQPTSALGLRLPLLLSVPKVGQKPAGTYKDVIRVVISPSDLLIN